MTSDRGAPERYEILVAELPAIAEAVNAFQSPEVQLSAFNALVAALSPAVATDAAAEQRTVNSQGVGPSASAIGTTNRSTKKRGSGKKSWVVPKDINFAPSGKVSLEDFVAQKQPRNQHERNVVACYYLSAILEIPAIDVGHVLAVYAVAGWPAPAHPDTSLQNTASLHKWLDTASMSDIKVVWAGTNEVENKLPGDRTAA